MVSVKETMAAATDNGYQYGVTTLYDIIIDLIRPEI